MGNMVKKSEKNRKNYQQNRGKSELSHGSKINNTVKTITAL